ncbi:hypothetical protein B0H16DRAFT_1485044 [Mycena metata]|uniref:Uncharacterized protein n=1 Tax=Mycena metata TaxID=1033252 RepID=A0AAD7GIF8_9AGAR|nr:hypothetical protein B0H16DRAFT_1485044 [Mycena metata]
MAEQGEHGTHSMLGFRDEVVNNIEEGEFGDGDMSSDEACRTWAEIVASERKLCTANKLADMPAPEKGDTRKTHTANKVEILRDGRRHRLYGWDGARKRGAVPSRHASGKMHERDGDGRPSTAVDGFPALTERFWVINTCKMPSAKVENAFTTRNTHVHGIKSFSTKVETSSESEAQRGELISPPLPRQSTIDGRLSAAPSRKGSKTRR